MPRYFFHMHHREYHPDLSGTEFRSDIEAWKQGTRACGEMLRDLDGRMDAGPEYRMECINSEGEPVFEVCFSARKHF